MDFFEAQALAKKRTHRLVGLFACAVVGTVLTGYLAALLLTSQWHNHGARRGYVDYQSADDSPALWQPGLFAAVVTGTFAVVGLAALYKWNEYAGGGAAVAESVGARRLEPGSADPRERQLLNVVEEMAIASGIPLPAVYVLDDEIGINAFAAGLTTSDAVVTVTRGTLDRLTRDELQGVIGHEFSHILNGDMRLNLRITALVFGILVIALAGRGLLYSLRGSRVRGKNAGGIVAALAVTGLALMVIGYLGWFFGRLIQAAISRQREFLADASSVQFTRNPGGITGALKKIGGYALGGLVVHHDTAPIRHFFFAQGFRSSFDGLMATHPPLDRRIRAIEPQFDGQFFEPPEMVDVAHTSSAVAGFAPPLHPVAGFAPPAQSSGFKSPPPPRRNWLPPETAAARAGQLTAGHLAHAQELLDRIPAEVREAVRDPARAPAVVCGLLLDPDPGIAERQLALVATQAGEVTAAALAALREPLAAVAPEARLPLLQLALPALAALDRGALDRLLGTLDELVHADGRVSPFEFALQKVLERHLHLIAQPNAAIGDIQSFAAVADEIALVLSVLARLSGDEAAAGDAFAAGTAQLRLLDGRLGLQPAADCTLARLDPVLDRLVRASGPIKRRLLTAAAAVIGADGVVTVEEGELYRALAAALDVPLPPLSAAA